MSKKLSFASLALTAAIVLASCAAPSQNTLDNSTAMIDSRGFTQADADLYQQLIKSGSQIDREIANRMVKEGSFNAMLASAAKNAPEHRHLQIGNTSAPEGAFTTKGIVTAVKWGVLVTINNKEYTLSRSFMKKFRDVLDTYKVAAVSTESIMTSAAYTALSTTGTVAPLNHANSTSEAAFVTALKTYSSASMPNYLYDGTNDPTDTLADDDASLDMDVMPTSDDINIINNLTGVRTEYYENIHDLQVDDGKLSAADIAMLQATTAQTWTYSLPVQASPAAVLDVPANFERTYFNALLAKNPIAPGVVLVDGAGPAIDTQDLSFYYADGDFVAADDEKLTFAKNATISNRPNTNFPQSGITNMVPTSASNLSGATAAMMARILVDDLPTNFAGLVTDLESATADDTNPTFGGGTDFTDVTYSDFHRLARELHMAAGAAANPVTTAPATELKWGTLPATPTSANSSSTTALSVAEDGTLGDALLGLGFSSIQRIAKSTGTSLRNKAGIEAFFGTTVGPVLNKALIAKCNRSSAGAITFSATGKHTVVITAEVTTNGDYLYSIYDPGYNNEQGTAYYTMGISNPASTMVTSLYNFSNWVIGVTL